MAWSKSIGDFVGSWLFHPILWGSPIFLSIQIKGATDWVATSNRRKDRSHVLVLIGTNPLCIYIKCMIMYMVFLGTFKCCFPPRNMGWWFPRLFMGALSAGTLPQYKVVLPELQTWTYQPHYLVRYIYIYIYNVYSYKYIYIHVDYIYIYI